MSRWIITGCNGYLGQQLCRGLVEDRPVIGVARPSRDLGDLSDLGVTCCSYDDLPNRVQPGDVLVHCAGKTGLAGTWEAFERTNVHWSAELFRQVAPRGLRCFVYVSSVAALGYRNRPGAAAMVEDAPCQLSAGELYGRSKWQAEQTLGDLANHLDTRLVLLRPGLIYGRRPLGKPQTWLRRGWVVDPQQRLPLVHIDNFLAALVEVVQTPDLMGPFFVVDPEQPTLEEFNRLKLRLGRMKYAPWTIGPRAFRGWLTTRWFVRRLLGRDQDWPRGHIQASLDFQCRRLVYSTAALRRATGWRPLVSLAEGCQDLAATGSPRPRPAETLLRRAS